MKTLRKQFIGIATRYGNPQLLRWANDASDVFIQCVLERPDLILDPRAAGPLSGETLVAIKAAIDDAQSMKKPQS